MDIRIVAGPSYTVERDDKHRKRYTSTVVIVAADTSKIVSANGKDIHTATVFGRGYSLPLAHEKMMEALQVAVDSNKPQKAVEGLNETLQVVDPGPDAEEVEH